MSAHVPGAIIDGTIVDGVIDGDSIVCSVSCLLQYAPNRQQTRWFQSTDYTKYCLEHDLRLDRAIQR